MIQIRPVSDLRNKFPEIETLVNSGNPVYLTKNGYGAMVVLSLEEYASLTDIFVLLFVVVFFFLVLFLFLCVFFFFFLVV